MIPSLYSCNNLLMYAGGEALHGTIWEIVTGQTGGKDINALSIVPPTHSDQVCYLPIHRHPMDT